MNFEENIKVNTISGKQTTIKLGCQNKLKKPYDDDDYDCACCIGGFSK